MNLDEAFSKWYASQDHAGLPWQTSRDELFNVFYAGWSAKGEAMKQTDLFPGTWAQDGMDQARRERTYEAAAKELFPDHANEAATELHPPCKRESVSSSLTVGSITAEEIYAAYPRKVGKRAAIKAITKAESLIEDGDHGGWDYLMRKTQAYAAAVKTWPAADKQYIPHPATWFNRGSYDDDPKEWSRGATTSQFSKTH